MRVCVGATLALSEAAGAEAAAGCIGNGEAAEAERKSGKPGSQTQKDSCHEGPS